MLTLIHHPEMIGTVVRHTPAWVGALLAALAWTGISQLRDRTAGLVRVTILPLAMTALSLWGLAGAFGASPILSLLVLAWLAVSAIAFAVVGRTDAPQGTRYDVPSSTFFLPGSWVPLVTIAAIFLTRYIVNVDVAITPALVRDGPYTLAVAALYGVFTGTFLGRAARLLRLAPQGRSIGLLLQRDPW